MKKSLRKSNRREGLVELLLFFCALASVGTSVAIVLVLSLEAATFFSTVSPLRLFTELQWTPLFAEKHYGILPLLSGTFLVTTLAMCVSLPSGLAAALYLSEFASPSVRRFLKPLLEVLAGIPTVVYGYFALLLVTPMLREFLPDLAPFNALAPGLVIGIMVLPMVISLSDDALRSIPDSYREGAYALGSTRLQTAFRVVLPAAASGVLASFVLAFSRAVGETMIVSIAGGHLANLTLNPLEPVQTMTAYMVQISLGDVSRGSIEYGSIFAVGLVLFLLTFALNALSHRLRLHFVKRFH